ncbi:MULTISPECIES: hypothetical protein [Streptomyces]|uniref:Uncharacterized protein n=1 Tax=[Kitasatospora] papulosa TaxID=1464011 RepID=A0ABZ1K8C8_9ACTN|nr:MULTISPECIES: hypothetical protein [unclassified Streptomyces]MCY1654185.1 hypothetical protein [Streptomyces sp. SL203]MCY1678537.1 hypothetical protein [Streptomyces sp. SL294]
MARVHPDGSGIRPVVREGARSRSGTEAFGAPALRRHRDPLLPLLSGPLDRG